MDLKKKRVVVYGNDVNLFVLPLANYNNIDCMDHQMKTLDGYTSVTSILDFFGHRVLLALLVLHALTGCDVTGKFSLKNSEQNFFSRAK